MKDDSGVERFKEIISAHYVFAEESLQPLSELFGFCKDDVKCRSEDVKERSVTKLVKAGPSFVSEFNKNFDEKL